MSIEARSIRVKQRNLINLGMAVSLLLCVSVLLLFWGIRETKVHEDLEVVTEDLAKSAVEELEAIEGSYNEQHIVLRDTTKEQAEKIAGEVGAEVRVTSDGSYAVLYLPEGTDIKSVYENEAYRGYLEQMEPDYYGTLASTGIKNGNDLSFYDTMESVNLDDTWDYTKGEGVTIAVIDTGIDTDNKYLASKISKRSFNATDGKVVEDFDLSVIEEGTEENVDIKNLHGTKVASVLAADYDAETGIGGIAPEAELLVIKVEPNETGEISSSDVMFAIAYAIECDADVINMSFTFEGAENPFERYTQLAVDSDIICVAAAGNKASGVSVWPAADENVIGVGAVKDQTIGETESSALYASASFGGYLGAEDVDTDDRYTLTDNSNYGDNTDIVAGKGMKVTGIDETVSSLTDTSCSSAIVSGSIALYLSLNEHQEFSQVKEVLNAASYDLGTPGLDWYYGCGLLDIHALVVEEKGTITYDYLTDEIDSESHIFVRGHKLQDVPEPERSYMVFDGWNYDIHCEEEWDNYENVLYEDLTVYASWVNEDDTEPYEYYVKDDGTAEILSYRGKRRYITMPSTIDGYTVTSVGSRAFYKNNRLRGIVFPNTLESIGEYAFFNCTKLLSAKIPKNVETIAQYAFSNCPVLGEIVFEEGSVLRTIGNFAFADCGKIRRVDLPGTLQNMDATAFFRDGNLITITIAEENQIFFADGQGLYKSENGQVHCVYYATGRGGAYVVDAETEVIDKFAFAYSKLSQAVLPDELKELGIDAFVYSGISDITIPDLVEKIPGECFYGCYNLNKVTFGSKLSTIDRYAFAGSSKLSAVMVKDDSALKTIGISAFEACGSLKDLSFLSSTVVLESCVFQYCSSIKEVILPKSLESLGGYAFASCNSLETIIFEDGIQLDALEIATFKGCSSLKNIVLPEGLQKIGVSCFEYTDLEYIHIPATVTSIGYSAFSDNLNLQIIEVSEENCNYVAIDNVLYEYGEDGTPSTLHTYPAGLAGAFVVPEEVKRIADYAFRTAQNLTDITFNMNLESIGENAFLCCFGLTDLQTNKNLESIGSGAFRACTSLASVQLNDKLTKLENSVFSECGALSEIRFSNELMEIGNETFYGCSSLSTIAFPNSLEAIGSYCFAFCSSLQNLEITENLVSIGRYAFAYDYALKEITFADNCKISRFDYGTFAKTGIESIVIPATITSLGQEVFAETKNLTSITFEKNSQLAALPAWVFNGAENLTSIIFEEGAALSHIQAKTFERLDCLQVLDLRNCTNLTVIDNYAFEYCGSLRDIILPDSITEIGRYAFYGCKRLTKLILPASVDFIGRYAFAAIPDINIYFSGASLPSYLQDYWDYGITGYFVGSGEVYTCGDWSYVLLNDGTVAVNGYTGADTEVVLDTLDGYEVSSIAARTLASDSSVQKLTLPDTVVSICARAFEGAASLQIINIPASVEYIGDYAFYNSGISQVTFEGNSALKTISAYSFAKTQNLNEIVIPDSVSEIKTYAFNESGLQDVSFGESSELTSISKYAFSDASLTSLALPDKLEKIDYHAFEGNAELAEVKFGDAVLDLYGYVFYNTGLSELEIPENIEYIGEYCFAYCGNLSEIAVADGNTHYSDDNGILFNKEGTKLITCPAGKTGFYSIPDKTEVLGCGAFEGSRLSSIEITNNSKISTIGYKAFYDCRNISEMNIPDNVQSIDFYAFAYCTQLASVDIGPESSMSGIYEGAFYGCESLASIDIPDTVWEIGEYAFYGCEVLETVNILETSELAEIYDYAFASTALSIIYLPETLCEIGTYAFANSELASVDLPESLKIIGDYAFTGLPIKEISITANKAVFGYGCFYNCNFVTSMSLANCDSLSNSGLVYMFRVMPSSLKYIEIKSGTILPEDAFNGCISLEEVKLPDELIVIGDRAFYQCIELKTISSDLSCVEEIGKYAFYKCAFISRIDTLTNVETFDISCFEDCTSLAFVEFSNAKNIKNSAFKNCTSLEKAIFSKKILSIDERAFFHCCALSKLIIPDGGLMNGAIGESAFFDTKLTILEIGEGVVNLGDAAFSLVGDYSSCIEELVLPDSIVKIGAYAFGNAYIRKIYIGDGTRFIGDNAFSYCQEIEFGSSIEYIGDYAFLNCQLKSIVLPDTVKEIGNQAFHMDIEERINEVFIPNSVEIIGENAFTNANVFFESSTLPENTAENWCENDSLCAYFNCIKKEHEGLEYYTTNEGACVVKYAGMSEQLDLSNINGESVCMIAGYCFANTEVLQTIILGDDIVTLQEGAFCGCTELETVDLSKVSNLICLEPKMFMDCEQLRSILLPDSIKVIEESAFRNCGSIISVDLPTSLCEIGERAFCDCISLSAIHLPEGLERIRKWGFYNCSSIKSVEFPSTMKTIGGGAFEYCTELEDISLNEGVLEIGDYAFRLCLSIEELVIPNTVCSMGNCTFEGCEGLERITLPKALESIGAGTFRYCSSLQSITIPENVKSISGEAFKGCSLLSSIIMEGVTTIGNGCFASCGSLERVIVPESATNISSQAFIGFSGMVCFVATELPSTLVEGWDDDIQGKRSILG